MKNITKLFLVIFLTGMSLGASAQHYGYYYVGNEYREANFMPHRVKKVIRWYHRNHDFNWVGTTEVLRGYRSLYIVTLQHGNRFMELTVDKHGEVINTKKYVKYHHRNPRPYRRGYASKKVIYHHDGYVYSRREERRHNDYPWQNNWQSLGDEDERDDKSNRNGKHSGYQSSWDINH